MLNARLVGRVESRRHLPHQRHRAGRRHGAAGLEQLAQIRAVDHAHVDEQHPVDLAVVVDRNDVGLLQPASRMSFALKALPEGRVVRNALREQLQRDDAVALGVLGLVDLTHAALADQPQQAVGAELGALPRPLLAHWTTFLRSSSLDEALMHPRCHQVTALLA